MLATKKGPVTRLHHKLEKDAYAIFSLRKALGYTK